MCHLHPDIPTLAASAPTVTSAWGEVRWYFSDSYHERVCIFQTTHRVVLCYMLPSKITKKTGQCFESGYLSPKFRKSKSWWSESLPKNTFIPPKHKKTISIKKSMQWCGSWHPNILILGPKHIWINTHVHGRTTYTLYHYVYICVYIKTLYRYDVIHYQLSNIHTGMLYYSSLCGLSDQQVLLDTSIPPWKSMGWDISRYVRSTLIGKLSSEDSSLELCWHD